MPTQTETVNEMTVRNGQDALDFERETLRYEKALGGYSRVYRDSRGHETDRNNFIAQLSLEAARPRARVTAVAECPHVLLGRPVMEIRMRVEREPAAQD